MSHDPRREKCDDNGLQKDMRAHLREGVKNPRPEGRQPRSHTDRGTVGWSGRAQFDPKTGKST